MTSALPSIAAAQTIRCIISATDPLPPFAFGRIQVNILHKLVCSIACLMLAGCAANSGNVAPLFSSPEALEGEVVTECGYLHYAFENVNFYPNSRQAKEGEPGVGVFPGKVSYKQLVKHHERQVCLTGRVRYTGCTVTMICSGTNFLYEIVVDDLVSR